MSFFNSLALRRPSMMINALRRRGGNRCARVSISATPLADLR
jgi:hypothetical protein